MAGNCGDLCPNDPELSPGPCGCGNSALDGIDTDGDTVPDCIDICPGSDDLMHDDEIPFAPPGCLATIPTASEWSAVTLVLLLLAAGTIVLRGTFAFRSSLSR